MTLDSRALQLTQSAIAAALDKQASQVIALDVSERLILTDAFVLASGSNERQVGAITNAIDEAMHKLGATAQRKEGIDHLRWVLMDYGDIVVHVQHEEDREFYALERLWSDCPVIPAQIQE